ncbi:MAG: cytochrome P450 [Chlamydiae bacterium]|nr:cytochrome P450 [Chlamydiota bacterium]
MNFYNYINIGIDYTRSYIETNYSPWRLQEEITKEAENGNIEGTVERSIIDLGQFLYEPVSCEKIFNIIRKVHVITDEKLIREALCLPRNGAVFGDYPTRIQLAIQDKQNMLLCPHDQHQRLRRPFEGILQPHYLNKSLIRKDLIYKTLIRSDFSLPKYFDEKLNTILPECDLTLPEAASSIKTLLAASDHTTYHTLSFIDSLLKEHPDWLNEIYEEWVERFNDLSEEERSILNPCMTSLDSGQVTLFKDLHEPISADSIDSFCEKIALFAFGNAENSPSKKLFAVVNEALRLYPVVPAITRVAKENLKIGDSQIQRGDLVVLNIMAYQRRSDLWENSTTFDPNRWLNGEKQRPLLNFSYGENNCIGQHLAKNYLMIRTLVGVLKAKKDSENFCISDRTETKYQLEQPFISIKF